MHGEVVHNLAVDPVACNLNGNMCDQCYMFLNIECQTRYGAVEQLSKGAEMQLVEQVLLKAKHSNPTAFGDGDG